MYPITHKSKFCKSSFVPLQMLQKSLLSHGLERSCEKIHFFCKSVWSTWHDILLRQDVLLVVLHLFLQKFFYLKEKVTHFFYLHLMHCSCVNESNKWKQLTISFSIQNLYSYRLKKSRLDLNRYCVWI